MKTTRRLIIIPSLIILLFATSCQKGGTGPEGAKGSPGGAGSANVIYSAWFTATPYVKDTVFDAYGFNYTKIVADLTQPVIDSGTVLTYGKLLGYNTLIWPATQVSQLPITINYKFSTAGITYTDTWSALITAGKLKIRFVNDQNYYNSIATSHQFRYIIIPGGKAANGRIAQLSQLLYHDVCDMYHIPE